MSRYGVPVAGVLLISSLAGAGLAMWVRGVALSPQHWVGKRGEGTPSGVERFEHDVLLDFGSQLVEAPTELTRRIRLRNPFHHRLRLVCNSRLPCCVKVRAPKFIEASSDAEVEVRVLVGPGTNIDLPVEVTGVGGQGVQWHLRVRARGYPRALVRAPDALVSVGGKPAQGTVTCERYGVSPSALDVGLKAKVTEPFKLLAITARDPVAVTDELWCRRWEVDLELRPAGRAAQGAATLRLAWSDGLELARWVGWRTVPVVSASPSVLLILGSNRSKTLVVASHDGRPFELHLAHDGSEGALDVGIEPGERRTHFVRVHARPGVSGRFLLDLATTHPGRRRVSIQVVVQRR